MRALINGFEVEGAFEEISAMITRFSEPPAPLTDFGELLTVRQWVEGYGSEEARARLASLRRYNGVSTILEKAGLKSKAISPDGSRLFEKHKLEKRFDTIIRTYYKKGLKNERN